MSIANLLRQTVIISRQTGKDKYNKAAFTDAKTYKARFQKVTKSMQTPNNSRTPITGLVWLLPNAEVTIDSKLEIAGQDYRVMSVDPAIDGRGRTRHIELQVQRWTLT